MTRIMTFEELRGQIANCLECPSLVASRRRVVPGYGDVQAKTMFIGLCPGRNGADLTGIPFTRDRSGQIFQGVMRELGFLVGKRFENAYVTNIVKCCPRDRFGRNRTPTQDEIACCRKYLQVEIDLIRPNFIITLGRAATECVLERRIARLSDVSFNPIRRQYATVIPSYHPSYVTRGAYPRERYFSEFGKLATLIC